jgi:hypothetical protein
MATTKKSEQNPADEVGADQVQSFFDEAAEKGYFGYSPDETPRENYSLQTPEDAYVPEVQGRVEEAEKLNNRKIAARRNR